MCACFSHSVLMDINCDRRDQVTEATDSYVLSLTLALLSVKLTAASV